MHDDVRRTGQRLAVHCLRADSETKLRGTDLIYDALIPILICRTNPPPAKAQRKNPIPGFDDRLSTGEGAFWK
jgi:hypothetical protein